ncbi:hypothetical protein PI124_g18454 [Phytophthora idaei]|nr:hypothetical protein PI125_g19237 [Phytophthora idaei]KAG3128793.1 hypothetical protein PI126_g21235 [Phytophthora idaei]KAG3236537.1 hypothetical protein PI124_g18454 [Phytophthora idaei]
MRHCIGLLIATILFAYVTASVKEDSKRLLRTPTEEADDEERERLPVLLTRLQLR